MELNDIKLTAVFIKVPEGGYSAYIEEIPGANSQGETLEEAKSNLKEALTLVMETNRFLSEKNVPVGTNTIKETLVLS
jgi:predicted RNase H-like HicB family nuclease